jgi:predicted transcriptional regulator
VSRNEGVGSEAVGSERAAREVVLMIVLRRVIGDELRRRRRDQGRTLREVSAAARVSLGYLSEVERGQKEASSELLAAICGALEVPLSDVLRSVSDEVAVAESGVALASVDAVVSALPSGTSASDVVAAA